MNRNLVISGAIAAALHGALLALPGGPTPKPVVMPPVLPLCGFEIAKEVELPEVELVNSAPEEPAPRSSPRPQGPDEVVVKEAVFETPVSPAMKPDMGRIREISAGAIGLSTGSIEGVRPMISGINLDNEPRTRVQVAPHYPHEAKAQGRTGEVWVEFVVDESGRVLSPRVTRSSDRIFEEPTLRAVAKWRFEPGRHRGQIVRFRMSVPVVFNLNE